MPRYHVSHRSATSPDSAELLLSDHSSEQLHEQPQDQLHTPIEHDDNESKTWHDSQQSNQPTNLSINQANRHPNNHTAQISNAPSHAHSLNQVLYKDDVDRLIQSRFNRRFFIDRLNFLFLIFLVVYLLMEVQSINSTDLALDPFSDDSSNIPQDSLNQLNNQSTIQSYFGNQSINVLNKPKTRVVLFILDGLRYDALGAEQSTNTANIHEWPPVNLLLNQLLNEPWFKSDSQVFKLSTQSPSISVPNWQSLVTGASPTLHGVLGNDFRLPFRFDSVFKSTRNWGLKNGITGDEWWSTLMSGHLTPFTGDGTSPTSIDNFGDVNHPRGHSDAFKDREYHRMFLEAVQSYGIESDSNAQSIEQLLNPLTAQSNHQSHRAESIKQTIKRTTRPFDYDLFMSYYADVDSESHAFGAFSDQTSEAIDQKVKYINQSIRLINDIDAVFSQTTNQSVRTIFLVTSDHGHVDVGGHGGDLDCLMNIPLIVYSKSSGLGQSGDSEMSSDELVNQPVNQLPPYISHSSLDISTTISALLGVPVPRQSMGGLITPLLDRLIDQSQWPLIYYDLFRQKSALAEVLIDQWRQHSLESEYQSINQSININSSLTELYTSTDQMKSLIYRSLDQQIDFWKVGNAGLAIMITVIVLFIVCMIYDWCSFVDLRCLFPSAMVTCYQRWRVSRNWLMWRSINQSNNALSERSVNIPTRTKRVHRLFCFIAFVIVCLFYSLMMFLLFVPFQYGYRPSHEWAWQFQLFNSALDAYVLMLGVGLLGSLIMFVSLMLLFWTIGSTKKGEELMMKWINRPNPGPMESNNQSNDQSISQSIDQSISQSVDWMYYVSLYCGLWFNISLVWFHFSQYYHCVWFPWVRPVTLIDSHAYNHRFQSLTLVFMLLIPQLGLTIVQRYVSHRVFAAEFEAPKRKLDDETSLLDQSIDETGILTSDVTGLAKLKTKARI